MTSEWLGEMFERDCAEICVGKIPLVPMGQGGFSRGTWEPGSQEILGLKRNIR